MTEQSRLKRQLYWILDNVSIIEDQVETIYDFLVEEVVNPSDLEKYEEKKDD